MLETVAPGDAAARAAGHPTAARRGTVPRFRSGRTVGGDRSPVVSQVARALEMGASLATATTAHVVVVEAEEVGG